MTLNSKLFGSIIVSLTFLLLCSCSEQEEVSDYENWQARNEAYVDSIATLARANSNGWTMLPIFTRGDSLGQNGENQYYVYVQKLENGTGTYSPLYTDSVRVHYSGRLIPTTTYPLGYNFGKSYNGSTLNEATDVPTLLGVSSNVTGFATALMHMVEGDYWRLVIPWQQGYGSTTNSSASIPAYSALIFEAKLARIYRYQIDTDTSWW